MIRVTTVRVKQPYSAISARVAIALLVAKLDIGLKRGKSTLW